MKTRKNKMTELVKDSVQQAESKLNFKSTRFSKNQLLIFTLVFAIVGGYVIFRTFAASVSTSLGSYESGNFSEFTDNWCSISKYASVVTSPVREGRYAAKYTADQNARCYGDNSNVRVHSIGMPTVAGLSLNNGSTFWYTNSVYIPSQYVNSNLYAGFELHQNHAQNNCTGPAPFNLGNYNGQWTFVVRGSTDCTRGFNQTDFGGKGSSCNNIDRWCKAWANGISPTIVGDQWYDFMFGWHMATDNTGWFEAWVNGPGTGGKSVQVVPRTYLQTSYTSDNYPIQGLYYNSPVTEVSSRVMYVDGGRFSTDFATLRDWQDTFTGSWGTTAISGDTGGTTTPPPVAPMTAVSSIVDGAVLSGTVQWKVNTSSPASSVDYFVAGTKVGSVSGSGTEFTYTFDTTKYLSATNGGFHVLDANGNVLYRSPSISFTVKAPVVTPPPLPAVGTNNFTAQYYDDQNLTTLKLTATDTAINFDWPSGTSPVSGVAATTYSTRWQGSYAFEASDYTFTVNVDDGVRLYIDGVMVLDQWGDRYATTFAVDKSLTAGNHIIKMEYYNSLGGGVAKLSWAKKVVLPTSPSGLSAVYYSNKDFTGTSLARIDKTVNFDWAQGGPDAKIGSDTFSARWTGKVVPTTSDTYTFTTISDDGVRLWVNGQQIINNWTNHAATTNTGKITLVKDKIYDIKLEYYDSTGQAAMQLYWNTPTIAKQIVPSTQLYSK